MVYVGVPVPIVFYGAAIFSLGNDDYVCSIIAKHSIQYYDICECNILVTDNSKRVVHTEACNVQCGNRKKISIDDNTEIVIDFDYVLATHDFIVRVRFQELEERGKLK